MASPVVAIETPVKKQSSRMAALLASWQGRRFLIVVLALAALMRFAWIFLVPNAPVDDFATYQVIAVNIAHGQGHPALGLQGPLYPLALGLLYRLVGSTDIVVAKLLNVVLSTWTVLLAYLIFQRLGANRFVVMAATLITAFLPNYIAYTGVVGSEVPFAFLFAVVLLLQISDFDWRLRYPTLGVIIGLAALTKPFFLPYALVLAVVEWLRTKDVKRSLRLCAVALLFTLLTIAPWTVRNYLRYHRFVLVTYNSGIVLFLNNNSQNTIGSFIRTYRIAPTPELQAQLRQAGVDFYNIPADEGQVPIDGILRSAAEDWIVHHPLQFTELGMLRLTNIFFRGADDIPSYTMNGAAPSSQAVALTEHAFLNLAGALIIVLSLAGFGYLILALRAAWRALRRHEQRMSYAALLPAANLVFIAAVYFVTEGQPRYNFPLLFLFAFCAAYFLDALRRLRSEPAPD